MRRAHAGKPAALIIRGVPGITYGRAVRASRTIYIKINHLIKFKTKAKYISISNTLHLLSAPACNPHVEAIWASLVVESKSYCKFFLASNFCLIVDLSFLHPER